MGMSNDQNRTPSADDLAAFALDALDGAEAAAVERTVAADPALAAAAAALRGAAGEYGMASVASAAAPASAGLRARVLDRATRRRPATPLRPHTEIAVHRLEAARTVELLTQLRPEHWELPVSPAEFAGWTVADVVAHLVTIESFLGWNLGDRPGFPEQGLDGDERTAATRARHRSLTRAEAVAELDTAVTGAAARIEQLTDEDLERDTTWWHGPLSTRTVLLAAAFEVWTHADDIREAVAAPLLPPPAPSLRTMSRAAVSWTPLLLAADGWTTDDDLVAGFTLTGPGGGTWTVALGPDGGDPPATRVPDVHLTLDVVAYCRALARRRTPEQLAPELAGDRELGHRILRALPSLATV
jgi:uncharacterized protein (TIGR03083 family)